MSEQQPEEEHQTEQGDKSADSSEVGQSEAEPGGITDEQLPEDLQPTEDNPLARHPKQSGDEDDKIGADTEGGDAENPSASMTYREDDDDSSDDES